MDQLDLTETIRIDTGLPFPRRNPTDHESPERPWGKTIVAEICSEFTDYRAQVEYFQKHGLIRLVHDKDSLPIVFSLGENHTFCALRHGTHQGEGWLCVDLTPVDYIATTFDVVQVGSLLYIAVACKSSTNARTHTLFFCTVDVAAENFIFENETAAKKQDKPGMQWTMVPDNTIPTDRVGAVAISSLLCKVLLNDDSSLKTFQVIVSTAQHDDKIATIYNVHTKGSNGWYWTPSSFPVAASLLTQTEPLILGEQGGTREEGLVSMVKDYAVSSRLRCVGQRCTSTGGYYSSFEYKAGELGNLRSAFSHLNIFGFTDVFIAAEKGIGFFSWQNVDTMVEEPILKSVSFKQVVVSEAEDPDQEWHSKLAIFAVSDENYLYFIEGTRDFSNPELKYSFEASGMPIRKGVTHLAARFNASHGTNELLYASSEDNALFFLRRVPSGTSWVEDKITQRALQHLRIDAFVTTMIWTDGYEDVLPSDYEISITADSLHAVVNGKGCTLSTQPVLANPDETGCILVAVPSASKTSCSPFQVSLKDTTKPKSECKTHMFSVDPSQRTSRLLSTLDDPEKLRNAKLSTGQPALVGMSPDQLKDAASMLRTFKTAKKNDGQSSKSSEDAESSSSGEGGSWFDDAVDGVEKFLGDAIEMMKNVVKKGVKLFVKVLGPVIWVVLKVAGKIIKWAVKGLFALLEVVGAGLELIFGWEGFSKFLKTLKLSVDPKEIAKTQKFLTDNITGVLKIASKALHTSQDGLTDVLADCGNFIRNYIDDPREPVQSSGIPGWIKKIFNNPFTRLLSKINPIGWILEALFEEIPDMNIPDISKLTRRLDDLPKDTMADMASTLQQLWEALLKSVVVVSANPSKIIDGVLDALKGVFWSFWDVATLFIETTFECLAGCLDDLLLLLTDEWNIPGLTDAWEDMTTQKFTVMGFITFAPAAIINMAFLFKGQGLPGREPVDLDNIEINPFYKTRKLSLNRDKMLSGETSTRPKDAGHHNIPAIDARVATPKGTISISETTISNFKVSARESSNKATRATGVTNLQSLDPATLNTAPIPEDPTASGKPVVSKGDNKPDDWVMPHMIELIAEDIGKSFTGAMSVIESIKTMVTDGQSYKKARSADQLRQEAGIEMRSMNPNDHAPVEDDPLDAKSEEKEKLLKFIKFFRGVGNVLQGIALFVSTGISVRNAVVKIDTLTFSSFLPGIFGIGEFVFFLCGLKYKKYEESLSITADICGSIGTVMRCVGEGTWDSEAISETAGSVAVAVRVILGGLKKLKIDPSTKLILSGVGVVSSVSETSTSVYGVIKCWDKMEKARLKTGNAKDNGLKDKGGATQVKPS
ncbi:hypothetical protein ACN47E_007151 [Coniothyrium glycines]